MVILLVIFAVACLVFCVVACWGGWVYHKDRVAPILQYHQAMLEEQQAVLRAVADSRPVGTPDKPSVGPVEPQRSDGPDSTNKEPSGESDEIFPLYNLSFCDKCGKPLNVSPPIYFPYRQNGGKLE